MSLFDFNTSQGYNYGLPEQLEAGVINLLKAAGVVSTQVDPITGARSLVSGAGTSLNTAAELISATPALATGGVKTMTAIVRNASGELLTNAPCAIRVNLPDGWAPAVTCMRVRDAAGTYVPWQWEPQRHARTDADISTHASTNIKAGMCWVLVPSLAAGAEATYTVEVWPTAQTQSFTAAIAKSAPDGSTDQYDHADWQAKFVAGTSWNLKNFTRKATSFDFFSASDAGVDAAFKPTNAGAAEYVGLTAGAKSQTSTAHGERDASTFGYGVVYCWYYARSVGVTQANMQHEQWYRLYANGMIEVKSIHKALAGITTSDLKLFFSAIKPNASGGTHVGSNVDLYVASDYGSGNRLLFGYRSFKTQSDEDGTFTGGVFPGGSSYYTASPVRLRAGANADNYALPSGAERREYMYIMLGSSDPAADLRRVWNPLMTTAAKRSTVREQLQRFGVQARSFLERYSTYSSADSGGDRGALLPTAWAAYARSGGGDQWALVPARLQAWLNYTSRGPADSGLGARLFANYKAATAASGWEWVGRDGTALYLLYLEAIRRNDGAVQATCSAILRGLADHAVLSEADNGSTGRIVLNYTDSPSVENPNATAEAAICLAAAAATGYAPAAAAAALARIWAALNATFYFRNWVPYLFVSGSSANGVIQSQSLSYFHRVTLALYLVPLLQPQYTTTVDSGYCLIADTNAQGQADEHRDNYNFSRRGSGATLLHFAANLAMYGNVSDIEQAIQILTHVNEQAGSDPSPMPIDGWLNNTARSVGDALCGALMLQPLQRLAG